MARLSVVFSVLTLIFLLTLHVLSPEYDPSWRMVSEYAHGNYNWVLSLMFLSWGISTWALALAIREDLKTAWGKIGLIFLVIAGIGEALASIFDIDHPIHDLAGLLGVLGLPIGAMLISTKLANMPDWLAAKKILLWTANFTWISVVLLISSLVFMYLSFTHAGGKISGTVNKLPSGVIGVDGWADRLLIVIYCIWVIVVAQQAFRTQQKHTSSLV